MRRLPVTLVRELDIEHHPESRPLHVASGSGLVLVGARLYVAIDDELHVGAFDMSEHGPGRLLRIFPGELPLEHGSRKAAKPDVESLFCVVDGDGSLLAGVPSGSTSVRTRGFAVRLDVHGDVRGSMRDIDWQPVLLAFAGDDDTETNVEGASVTGNELLLFLRGVTGVNRIARLSLELIRAGLDDGRIDADALTSIVHIELGQLDGVPLGFTDAEALADGRIVVTASAEDTVDAYQDGAVVGSVVLLLDPDLRSVGSWRLDADVGKIEGVVVERVGDEHVDLLLVTDDDDASSPARLYRATLAM